jgi:dTDP-4-dehydrorhamnose reductase
VFNNIVPSNVLITGAKGQLGSELVEILSKEYNVIPVDKKDFDITEFKSVQNYLTGSRPDIVIHTAAFTDVDACEKQKSKAFKVNGIGTKNLAIMAKKLDAKFFYISTDYVFNGEKEDMYFEYDSPDPKTIYGLSKLLGENFVKEQLNKFFILRIAWLYGKNGENFVKTMLDLAGTRKEIKVVDDQTGSPTWTFNIIRQIKKLMTTDFYGTYHCTSQGSCTWFEFALEIFRQMGYEEINKNSKTLILQIKDSKKAIKLKKITSQKLKSHTRRPRNTVLENYMLKIQNLDIMPHWKESLATFMDSLIKE